MAIEEGCRHAELVPCIKNGVVDRVLVVACECGEEDCSRHDQPVNENKQKVVVR